MEKSNQETFDPEVVMRLRCAAASIHIGCAGWSIPKAYAGAFPREGSHLERYAQRLPAVEINSSFYRPHRPSTYARWAGCVPEDFRFSAKMPREITHSRRLLTGPEPLDRFLGEIAHLGKKLGPVLIQLPPSLGFDAKTARTFFSMLRQRFRGSVVCEPRHRSWFAEEPELLLASYAVARVCADPAVVPEAAAPGGWKGHVYFRLHGSPQIYASPYSSEQLRFLSHRIDLEARLNPVWCIFDNTIGGVATANALTLLREMCWKTGCAQPGGNFHPSAQ
jgi:uncharacterized protein YecE (DUF72 family)